jgi:hypothetical protein
VSSLPFLCQQLVDVGFWRTAAGWVRQLVAGAVSFAIFRLQVGLYIYMYVYMSFGKTD